MKGFLHIKYMDSSVIEANIQRILLMAYQLKIKTLKYLLQSYYINQNINLPQ